MIGIEALRAALATALEPAAAARVLEAIRPGLLLRKKFTEQSVPQKPLLGFIPRRPKTMRVGQPSSVGSSRMGGVPNLPTGVEWPRPGGKPAAFLAQINCTDIATHADLTGFPPDGWLHFFYDLEGWDASRPKGSPSVIYTPAGSELRPAAVPEGRAAAEIVFPAFPVEFVLASTFPDGLTPEFDALRLSEAEEEAFFEALAKWERAHVWGPVGDSGLHRIGGHAGCVQGDVREEFAQAAGEESDAADWRLLLEFDSDNDLGVMWGDAGKIYFGLREADLRARRFDRTQVVMQCY